MIVKVEQPEEETIKIKFNLDSLPEGPARDNVVKHLKENKLFGFKWEDGDVNEFSMEYFKTHIDMIKTHMNDFGMKIVK